MEDYQRADLKSDESINWHSTFVGRDRGIQGQNNSCYLDATLMSMFAFNSSFDILLQNNANSSNAIKRTLKSIIEEELRKKGYVSSKQILKLRKELLKLDGVDTGLIDEERDPEEFLNLLLNKGLNYTRIAKMHQIIADKNPNLKLPTVQRLLEQNFNSDGLKLENIPENLILIMPRYGKKDKIFEAIFPQLQLDLTELLKDGKRICSICGDENIEYECQKCLEQTDIPHHQWFTFCPECNQIVHNNRDHEASKIKLKNGGLSVLVDGNLNATMDLFAVLCIETSHYVAFIKSGLSEPSKWVFFDSMADREGPNENAVNIPEVVSDETELDLNYWLSEKGYVEMANGEMIPKYVQRLLKDIYMVMYRPTHLTKTSS